MPVDPGQVDYLFGQLLDGEPREVIVIRDALSDHKNDLLERLWVVVERPEKSTENQRLRAACALAAYDPDDPRWNKASAPVAEQLVAGSPVFLGTWTDGFRPISPKLVGPLSTIFRDCQEDRVVERTLATHILADYLAGQPKLLTDLLLDGDEKQFAALFPKLRDLGNQGLSFLEAELDGQTQQRWHDSPLDPSWKEPDPALRRQIEAARGVLAERFAFTQTMPLEEFLALAESLRNSGYRPIRFRPYLVGKAVQVAAVWTRDGHEWQLAHGFTAEQLYKEDQRFQGQGYVPADVAGYLLGSEKDGLVERYGGLWIRAPQGETRRLYVGVPEGQQLLAQEPLKKGGFIPLTLQALAPSEGRPLYCSVWRKGAGFWNLSWGVPEESFPGQNLEALELEVAVVRRTDSWQQVGPELLGWFTGASSCGWGIVPWSGLYRWSQGPSRNLPGCWYGGVWQIQPTLQDTKLTGLDPVEHLARCRDLIAQSYRPASVAVADMGPGRPLVAASVWHRPVVTEHDTEKAAKRQANAVVALLKLGQPQSVWPLLKLTPDPRLRSYLIDRLGTSGADPGVILQRLDEKEVSMRRALLLVLGEFGPDRLPASDRESLEAKIWQLYRDDPDPGLHGAAEWVLRQWKQQDKLQEIDRELATGRIEGNRGWYLTHQGRAMVVIAGPAEFLMGSPPTEAGREGGPTGAMEKQHWKRIGRSFAIATKDVTVADFLRFRKDHEYHKQYAPTGACPVADVTWYEAAGYCNWLSKQEGISEDQWCYLPNALGEFAEGMKPVPGYLHRTGYRLPSEAEWEYACRAGTATSRSYGETEELLDKYAWYMKNSQDRGMVPGGSLKPNDLGLFDMLGNVVEWCQEPFLSYTTDADDGENYDDIKDNQFRVMRGGSFYARPVYVRSACRFWNQPGNRGKNVGFRLARNDPLKGQRKRASPDGLALLMQAPFLFCCPGNDGRYLLSGLFSFSSGFFSPPLFSSNAFIISLAFSSCSGVRTLLISSRSSCHNFSYWGL